MLKPGGRLVYSTCTFSPEENEGVIDAFLKLDRSFEIESVQLDERFGSGRREWIPNAEGSLDRAIRLWPHQIKGEGHFFAVMRKLDGGPPGKRSAPSEKSLNQKQLQHFFHFGAENLKEVPKGRFALFGDQLYIIPECLPSFQRLKILRPGWHLGTLKKNRFEPSHAFALSLHESQVQHSVNFSGNSDEMRAYLRGETLKSEGPKGWYLVNVDGYSIGWGKLAGGLLKNRFPKGLRWTH
jgi:NOL1/NOP2/fmu family ribosome biogenesis protein